MGKKTKKRQLETDHVNIKSTPVEVIMGNLESHPLCLHGPTLLFSGTKGRYFSCSSCRNKKDCTVHITEEDWANENVKKRNQKYLQLIPKVEKIASWENFINVKSQHQSDRAYCVTCQELYIPSQTKKHNSTKNHCLIAPITNDQLGRPSTWLPTLENDAKEAQYMFTKKSVSLILGTIMRNNIRNILCIGTPTIHEAAQSHPELDSVLLDYDKRHHQFWPADKYLWYNMFNNFLFNRDEDKLLLNKFIKGTGDNGLCVVMDPPFGGRVEPLVHTLQQLGETCKKFGKKDGDLKVIWAFPYFSEPYIENIMPELSMHDFQVEYENHSKFHSKNNKGRKFGSPVRLFTNLPLASFDLSQDKSYKFCEKCKYWVASSNQHCVKCGKCASKNGMTYKHCNVCRACVKPTFFHCSTCARCCQQKDHVCGVLVLAQSCFNCQEKGHKKVDCPLLEKQGKKKRKVA